MQLSYIKLRTNSNKQVTWKSEYVPNVGLYSSACVPSFKVILLELNI